MSPGVPPTGSQNPSRTGWQWSVVRSRIDATVTLLVVDVANHGYAYKTWDDEVSPIIEMLDPHTFWDYMESTVEALTLELLHHIGQR